VHSTARGLGRAHDDLEFRDLVSEHLIPVNEALAGEIKPKIDPWPTARVSEHSRFVRNSNA
jgi:hypothetical protein